MKIMITGTDRRSCVIEETLKEKLNCEIYRYDGTVYEDTSVIILPTPVTSDGVNLNFTDAKDKNIETLLSGADENTLIIGAGFNHSKVYDLCTRDDFSIENAIPTAEGAVAIAIENTQTTLFDSNILVTGFGRIARILLDRLRSFRANLTVAARKSGNLAEIEALGMNRLKISEIEDNIQNFDIVFNTVPYCVFDSNVISHALPHTLFIELASRQAGFDTDSINKLPYYVNAPGLPGKVAPISAGKIMAKTIITLLSENNLY